MLPSTLVPASKAEEHLELRHPETHHHVLWRSEKFEDPTLHRPVLPKTLGLSYSVGNALSLQHRSEKCSAASRLLPHCLASQKDI